MPSPEMEQANPPQPPLHQLLWAEADEVAEACLAHPFVQGLGDGSLSEEAFRAYVAQDAFFLRAFFSAYALAAARAAAWDTDTASRLHALMGGVLDELRLHAKYAAELEIDLENVVPNPAARAYTDFLLRVAWGGTIGEILAAMTPCMRLYAYLGQALSHEEPQANPYKDWVETYASEEFEGLASELESLLDRLAEPSERVRQAYRYAMDCELAFFSAFSA